MKILAVDDDDIALDLLASALGGLGYVELTTASSPFDALRIVAADQPPFDAFLLDIQMPGMDGIELCAKLREMPVYATVPIIMITAMQDRQYIDQAFAAGAVDYINKPFDPIELGARIGIAARLSSQAHQVEETATAVAFLQSRTGFGTQFNPEEAITIRDVPRVISMTAMENYLLRLTFLMALRSKSVVFSISGFHAIHAQCNPSDMYDILADCAGAVTHGLKHTSHLVTYVGDGRFVAVINGQGPDLNDETLWAIQAELDENQPVLSNGRPCPVTLLMGEVYSPGIWSAPNRLNLLLRPQELSHPFVSAPPRKWTMA